jgi:hypothetical protein
MIDIQEVIAQIPNMSDKDQCALFNAIQLHFAATQVNHEIVPMDLPIECTKNVETGFVTIRYPYTVGLKSVLHWKEVEVTPAAQAHLHSVFAQSLEIDAKAGKTPPKPATLQ